MSNESIIVDKQDLTSIANTVRAATGTTEEIPVQDLPERVAQLALNSGGGSGLPAGHGPNQVLATNENGAIAWEDKTHYSRITTKLCASSSAASSDLDNYEPFILDNSPVLELDKIYTVTLDGDTYQAECIEDFGTYCIGSIYMDFEDYPFLVISAEDGTFVYFPDSKTHTISISCAEETVSPIDRKYLSATNGGPHQVLSVNENGETVWFDMTHWDNRKNEKFIDSVTVSKWDSWGEASIGSIMLSIGKTYTVEFDGTEYECVCISDSGTPVLGSTYDDGFESYPFMLYSYDYGDEVYDLILAVQNTSMQHTISVTGETGEIKKIDNKFISDSVLCVEERSINMPEHDANYSLTYGNGIFVAFGDEESDVIFVAHDNLQWSEVTLPASAYWAKPAYGNGKFVSFVEDGAIYSEDGINWTVVNGPFDDCYGVDFYQGKFFIYGNSDVIYYSEDGTTWDLAEMGYDGSWGQMAYGNGIFVRHKYETNVIAWSYDGLAWVDATLPITSTYLTLSYANDRFVVAASGSNQVAYSYNGRIWTAAELPSSTSWGGVGYGDGKYVTIGEGVAAYSYNCNDWEQVTIPTDVFGWEAPVYCNNVFMAKNHSAFERYYYSRDGIEWNEIPLPETEYDWYDLHLCGDRFFALSFDGAVVVSTDCENWEATTSTIKNAAQEDVTNQVKKALGIKPSVQQNNNGITYFSYTKTGFTSGTDPDSGAEVTVDDVSAAYDAGTVRVFYYSDHVLKSVSDVIGLVPTWVDDGTQDGAMVNAPIVFINGQVGAIGV